MRSQDNADPRNNASAALSWQDLDMTRLGVDIASVDENRKVDWRAARGAGVEYAFLRGTYDTWADPLVKRESVDVEAAEIILGYYAFLVPGPGHPSPEQQVRALRDAVGPLGPGRFPAVLDFEYPHGVAGTGLSRKDLILWCLRAAAAARAIFTVNAIAYSSERVIDGSDSDSLDADASGLDLSGFADMPPWLARYPWPAGQKPRLDVDGLAWPPVPKMWGDAGNVWIHQYMGDSRGLAGFSSTVDLNRFRVLSIGDHGRRVAWTQRRVGAPVDGDFGPITRAAVTSFQVSRGLALTGSVDPATFSHLAWVKP